MQVDWPESLFEVPEGHAVQALAPCLEYVFWAQVDHEVEPAGEYCPKL